MPNTRNIQHPYPSQNQRDWFSNFVQFADSLDASDFASRDDRNISIVNAGTIGFGDVGGGIYRVTWSDDLNFYHGSTGFSGSLAADVVGINLEDGDAVYVTAVRGPSGAYTVGAATKTSSGLPANDNALLLFCRIGDQLWVRGYGSIPIGGQLVGGGSGAVGKVLGVIPFVMGKSSGEGLSVVGRVRVNVADYSDNAVTVRLRMEAQNTALVITSDVDLYDVTAGDTLKAHFDIDNDDQPNQTLTIFTPDSLVDERVYELRAGLVVAGPGSPYTPTDEIIIWHAAIEIVTA